MESHIEPLLSPRMKLSERNLGLDIVEHSARKEQILNYGSLEIFDDYKKIVQLQLRRDDDDDGMRDKRANSLRRSAVTVFTLHRNARAAVALNHGYECYDVNVRRKEEEKERAEAAAAEAPSTEFGVAGDRQADRRHGPRETRESLFSSVRHRHRPYRRSLVVVGLE